MRLLKTKTNPMTIDFIDFELELDEYPEYFPKLCGFIYKDDLYELLYVGEKKFKLLAINENFALDITIPPGALKKGLIIDEG